MLEFRERIRLIHELRKLGAHEEFAHRTDDRPRVNELRRSDLRDVLRRHAVFHDALHARKTDPETRLDKLADRADATVPQMVHIVRLFLHVVQPDNFFQNSSKVFFR